MKKIFTTLFCIFAILFNSCSKNDDTTLNPDNTVSIDPQIIGKWSFFNTRNGFTRTLVIKEDATFTVTDDNTDNGQVISTESFSGTASTTLATSATENNSLTVVGTPDNSDISFTETIFYEIQEEGKILQFLQGGGYTPRISVLKYTSVTP